LDLAATVAHELGLSDIITPALTDYCFPELSRENEHSSFYVQSDIAAEVRTTTVPPDRDEYYFVLAAAENAYSSISVSVTDWDSYDEFLEVVNELDKTSSPGYPYNLAQPTIGKWLDFVGFANPQQLRILWDDVQLVFSAQYHHYFRVFQKDEPHTVAKRESKRWRLITAASLPMQVAMAMLCRRMNAKEDDRWHSCPSAQGLPVDHGGWKLAQSLFNRRGLVWEADKSAWDFNAPGWVFHLDLSLRANLSRNRNRKWDIAMTFVYSDAFQTSRLLMTDGTVFQQTFDGFMKSGLVNTITTNSHAQFFQHVLACHRLHAAPPPIIAAGDDVLMCEPPPGYAAELGRTGCILKMCRPGQGFLGYDWTIAPIPLYPGRHLYHFAMQEEAYLEETLDAYAHTWAQHPGMHEFWRIVAERLGLRVPSRSTCLVWFDRMAR
jgi:hypothetical protein